MLTVLLRRRLIFAAILLLVAGIGVTGWPFQIDVWGINQQFGLALALVIPFSIIWAGFASPRHDVRWAGCIVALPVLPIIGKRGRSN